MSEDAIVTTATGGDDNGRVTMTVEDPDAPFGRREDGTPYKIPPERRAELAAQMAAGRARAAATGRTGRRRSSSKGASAPGRSKPQAPPAPSYATMVAGLMQLPAMILGVASRFVPVLAYDAMAISYHTPPIAKAVEAVALSDARWASVIEKTANVGPYGELAIALLPLALQIGANHRWLPPAADLGVLPPEDLMKAMGVEDGPTAA